MPVAPHEVEIDTDQTPAISAESPDDGSSGASDDPAVATADDTAVSDDDATAASDTTAIADDSPSIDDESTTGDPALVDDAGVTDEAGVVDDVEASNDLAVTDAEPDLVEPTTHKRRPLALALLVEARPKQWVKNVLVFAAPGAAGVLGHSNVWWQAFVAFAAFCLAASGTYYLNDAGDVEADRAHVTKRFRPIAAGEIPLRAAQVIGAGLIVAAIGLSFAAAWQLALTVGAYVALTTCYTMWWKHVVLFDVVAVAGGFVLRAIGGAAATGVVISNWFFIVTTFGSLFMVACKRSAEARTTGAEASKIRATLGEYSDNYLAYMRAVASGVMLVAYCLWAFEKANLNRDLHIPWFQLSIVPFAIAVLRYALLVDQGHGGEPEEVVFADRVLQVLGVAWIALFTFGIYKVW